MFVVRLLTLVIFAGFINGQAYAMFSTASRFGWQGARRLYSGQAQKKASTLGQVAFAIGVGATVGGGIALCLEARDNAKMEENDLQGFIEHAIERGNNPNHFVNKSGKTALMLACEVGDCAAVEKLIEYGDIDINRVDNDEQSVLSYAIKSGEKDIVSLILEIENIDVNDTSVQAALFRNRDPEIREIFADYEYKQLLKSIANFLIKHAKE